MTKTGYRFRGWYTLNDRNSLTLWNFFTDTVTSNITLYAIWDANPYTVDFEANGGSPAPAQQTIARGGRVVQPPIAKTGYSLSGWYKEAECINQWDFATDTVTSNITLYAKWEPPIVVSGTTLAEKLQWLSTHAASNSSYILEVTVDEDLDFHYLSYTKNITIQLKGIGSSRNITSHSSGLLFSIGNGVTLILEENLVLIGGINSNGTLIMNQGVKITGTFGSGVSVDQNGTFTMNGGKISGNTSSYGGGVSVSGGTFTMSGGEISGNTSSYGGGVSVSGGTFTMSGGTISGNTSSSYNSGGGVSVSGGTFTMSGGTISGNTSYDGGGVYVGGTFTMSGGTISQNTSSSSGGGVYVNSSYGTFTKSGDGTITGYSSDTVNGNVVKQNGVVQSNQGHAVYVDSSPVRRRETTAGSGVYLNSRLYGTTGGWEE